VSDVLLVDEPAPGVRRLTLNRPDQLNALSRELAYALIEQLRALAGDDEVRAVVLRGNGRAFCAGADLGEHFTADGATDIGRTELWDLLESLRVPVIAAVHGWAITGGFLLAYCCDMIVASSDATFRDTHAVLGLVPTGGESQRLPRRIGVFRARELMLTSRPFPAREAYEAGLVSRVVPRENLDAAALELAAQVVANSSRSVTTIKHLINRGVEGGFGAGLRLEAIANDFGAANNVPDADRDARIGRVHR
jgi:enoyl-CoA hydratase